MRTIITILTALILTACANSKQDLERGYQIYHDQYKGFTRYTPIRSGALNGQGMLSLSFVYLDVFVDKRGENYSTGLAIIYTGENWMFINPGESLVLMIDGEKMALNSEYGSLHYRKVITHNQVREEAPYFFSAEQIKMLADASNVSLRLYTQNGWLERQMSPENLDSIRLFYNNVMAPIGLKST